MNDDQLQGMLLDNMISVQVKAVNNLLPEAGPSNQSHFKFDPRTDNDKGY